MPSATSPAAPGRGLAVQHALDELGTPLAEVAFVVVDLETTGGSPNADAITEIGAVRVRGGVVEGELGTLVDPGRSIPPTITVLTGITNAMVIGAPPIEEVLPSFLEFAHGAVLVAHNARFDTGFLRVAAERMGLTWPKPLVVDTVQLARRVVSRDEAPNHRLGSLARLFHASVTPDHRALTDARATVDVLHGLLARMAPLGVTHLEDLRTAGDSVPPERRRKVTLADGLPAAPGVYQFLGPQGRVLYVGTATNLRTRVRSYFTASEKRARIGEMLRIAERVHPIVCATPLEAAVRELRLIAEHSPPYNRRSRAPEREPWIRLTDEAYPRLSVVREVPRSHAGAAIGPFRTRRLAQLALEALHGAFPLRQCSPRLPRVPRADASPCVLAELGRCGAPCVGRIDEPGYDTVVADVRAVLAGDVEPVVATVRSRIAALAGSERYEDAARERDRLTALLRGSARAARLGGLADASHVLAARRTDDGGWELVCARYGRLAGVCVVPRGADVMGAIDAVRATAEHVPAPERWCGAASAEETELVLTWLERPGVRLVELAGAGWSAPVRGAARVLADLPGAVADGDRDAGSEDVAVA
ncbi:DNA polymerase III, epsilon subunit [Beutenbergia cavernae DSM 12333]|uniref:DNA polymerase III, epsilon subunit n=1 Tax=Beutenbergia cavernae (strain ATCC BAA-8 / DSM 12333 / CCUG 43141 / JCM 11478 / NBRC 16432 / NCIMB 13614 / HKI 0122) TaxID=471853 RepID=C5C5G5_BEUC1|nr:DEDD exonuclease domain-containing protein [Beutenbergia cavernae]ACQ80156.1 DNA polymerase III, epsilon subunit [Beutenbergia cavernae DSM 12333]